MEAMDRAQAAFYEEEEASRVQVREVEPPVRPEQRLVTSDIVSSKRSRRLRNQQDGNTRTTEEEEEVAESSPRKRRKVVARADATDATTEARRKPSAKALGKRKAVSQEPDTVNEDVVLPPHKRSAVVHKEVTTTFGKATAPASKLPRRTAAVTRSSTQLSISEDAATRVIDEKAQLAREAAAAARKAARQPKELASRASARRKKAA
jgi:hypothetical protein